MEKENIKTLRCRINHAQNMCGSLNIVWTGLTLLDSNFPVSLTSARWESGSTIEMKYMDLVLPKA